MIFEEVNPVECSTIEGIDVKQITLTSRRNNSLIIRDLNNAAKHFNSVNCAKLPIFLTEPYRDE